MTCDVLIGILISSVRFWRFWIIPFIMLSHNSYFNFLVAKTNLPENLRKIITDAPYKQSKQKDVRRMDTSASAMDVYMDSSNVYHSEPLSATSRPYQTSGFVRYNDDMTGFLKKTDMRRTDQSSLSKNGISFDNKENQLCRRESMNGSDEQLAYRSLEGSEHDEIEAVADTAIIGKEVIEYRHPHHMNARVTRPLVVGSHEDLYLPSMTTIHSTRPSRSSVSCVREISDVRIQNGLDTETLQIRLIKANEELEKAKKEKVALKNDFVRIRERYIQSENKCHSLQQENCTLQSMFNGEHQSRGISVSPTNDTRRQFSNTGLHKFLNLAAEGMIMCSHTNQMTLVIKESLKQHWMKLSTPLKLDVPNKEWFPGGDYVLIGEKPISCINGEQRSGSNSLVFHIKHKSKSYVLKVNIYMI